jgi:hypothetical protein
VGTVALSALEPLSFGSKKAMLATVTGSASYATNGDTVVPANAGITTLLGAIICGMPGGYTVEFDLTNLKFKFYRTDVASTSGTAAIATSTGNMTDDDAAASTGTALNVAGLEVSGTAGGSNLLIAASILAGNADTTWRIGSAGPHLSISDDDTPGGVQLYFDEDAVATDKKFLAVLTTVTGGQDGFLMLSDGKMLRVVHDASAASNGVAVYIDDDAASAHLKGLFVSPTNASTTFLTDDEVTLDADGLTITTNPAAATLTEVANAVSLAAIAFPVIFFGH